MEEMVFDSICIFCSTGRTFTFRDVEVVCDNETVVVFLYKAMSDGHKKQATFLKANIVGYSILSDETELQEVKAKKRH